MNALDNMNRVCEETLEAEKKAAKVRELAYHRALINAEKTRVRADAIYEYTMKPFREREKLAKARVMAGEGLRD